jgi:predicted DNA binding protein
LSDQLDLPRSTVQYRLRSAEDLIVSEFVRNTL